MCPSGFGFIALQTPDIDYNRLYPYDVTQAEKNMIHSKDMQRATLVYDGNFWQKAVLMERMHNKDNTIGTKYSELWILVYLRYNKH